MKKEDWISIEHEKPDIDTPVLMYAVYRNPIGVEYGEISLGVYLKRGALVAIDADDYHLIGTHWMPLPEPPEISNK